MTELTTLVLNGTGKTGRRIVERLRERGVPTRVGSRRGEPPFDWYDRSTWGPALDGVASAYVSFFPDLAVPGAPAVVRAFAELAVERGVRRLVLLSGRGEEEAERAEQDVRAVSPDATILRCAWFCQNFSEDFMAGAVASGVVALPVDAVREPFVDTDDVADVAVAALTDPGHEGRLYELTGPRLLTFAEAIAEIAAASGRDVRFQPISIEEFEAGLAQDHVPADTIELLRYLFTEVLDGRNESTTDGMQRALGRPARDFGDYARAAAAAGAWSG